VEAQIQAERTDMTPRQVHQPAQNGTRRTIATHADYRDAERDVDWLSDHGFAVEHVAIVGTGLRYVEQVAGRVTTRQAAWTGAGQGMWVGLIFGLLFGLFFNGAAFLGILLYGLVVGGLSGALWGAATHYSQQGRRDFASVAATRAYRYEVQVDAGLADTAERLLAGMPGGHDQATRAA
jgi:predicted lipid-binding transport protein (Tim44 family)